MPDSISPYIDRAAHITDVPTFHIVIHADAETGGYWAACDMPDGGCNAQNDTLRETQRDMLDAIKFYLEDYPDISDYFLTFEVSNA